MIRPGTIALALATLAATTLTAVAQHAPIQIGTLTCVIEPQPGSFFGSSKDIDCAFAPTIASVMPKSYEGTMTSVGLEVGSTGKTTLVWGVVAPVSATADGVLNGTYVGSTISGSFGAGFGSNVLFGGSGNTVALQPVSLQFQTGFNATLGALQITLSEVVPEEISDTDDQNGSSDPALNQWSAESSKL